MRVPGSGLDTDRLGGPDALAFAASVGFAASLYSSVVSLVPALEPLRPALATAGIAFALLVFGRVARARPIGLDGWRGAALLGLVGWAWLSMTWSIEPAESRSVALELAKLAAIYLTVVNLANTPRRVGVLAGAVVLASLAPSLGAIDRWHAGVDLVDGYRARWLGVYADPNHLAMSLVAILPVAIALTSARRSIPVRLMGGAAAVLAVSAIALTHSRGGVLGLALALALWAVTGGNRTRSLAAVAAVAVGLALFAPRSFWTRTESIAAYEADASALGRTWAWEVAAAIGRDRPLTGVGAGGFRHAWSEYAPPAARGVSLVAHNVFLAQLGDLGLVGFALFLAFVASVVAGGASAWRDPRLGPLSRALSAGFAGYILCAMLSGYVLSAHFFFLAALAASAGRVAGAAPGPDRVPGPDVGRLEVRGQP